MDSCMEIHPGIWPPLGALPDLLAIYEPQSSVATLGGPKEVTLAAMEVEGPPAVSATRPLEHLSEQQVRAEIVRLERHLLELTADAFHGLRDQLEASLSQCRGELQAKLSNGQTLDQASSKLRLAQKTKTAAAEHLQKVKAMLASAETALQQAEQQEEQARQTLTQIHARIGQAVESPPKTTPSLAPQEVAGLCARLRQAGLQDLPWERIQAALMSADTTITGPALAALSAPAPAAVPVSPQPAVQGPASPPLQHRQNLQEAQERPRRPMPLRSTQREPSPLPGDSSSPRGSRSPRREDPTDTKAASQATTALDSPEPGTSVK